MKVFIQIQYYGSVRAAAGKREEEMEASPGTSVFQLLKILAERYGDAFRGELINNGQLRDDIGVSLNGTLFRHEMMTRISLQDGDTLALLPLFPGGG